MTRVSDTDAFLANVIGKNTYGGASANATVAEPGTGYGKTVAPSRVVGGKDDEETAAKRKVSVNRSVMFLIGIVCLAAAGGVFAGILVHTWVPTGLWPHLFAAMVASGALLLCTGLTALWTVFDKQSRSGFCLFMLACLGSGCSVAGVCVVFISEGLLNDGAAIAQTWGQSASSGDAASTALLCMVEKQLNCTGWNETTCNASAPLPQNCVSCPADDDVPTVGASTCHDAVVANMHRFAPFVYFTGPILLIFLLVASAWSASDRCQRSSRLRREWSDAHEAPTDNYRATTSESSFRGKSSFSQPYGSTRASAI